MLGFTGGADLLHEIVMQQQPSINKLFVFFVICSIMSFFLNDYSESYIKAIIQKKIMQVLNYFSNT
jgi:hypothetical protein